MTSLVEPGNQRSFVAALWRRAQRERALVLLFDVGREKTRGLRAARVYAFGVFIAYAIAIALSKGAGRSGAIHGLVQAALSSSSWVVGALAALGTTQALAQQAESPALVTLAAQRGFSGSAVLRARTWAAAVQIARLVALPALLLVAVGLARGGTFGWAFSVAPAVIVYACVLGVSLAVLAHVAASTAPRHPRALLGLLVLTPLLVALAYPAFPNVYRLFSGLLAQLLAAGARLS